MFLSYIWVSTVIADTSHNKS